MSENKMASSQLEHHLAGRGPFPGILLPCQSFIFQDIYLRLGMIKDKNYINMCFEYKCNNFKGKIFMSDRNVQYSS